MPKTFISFLGAGVYQPTQYFFPEGPAAQAMPTPYVQQAILSEALTPMDAQDRIYLFTTEAARACNFHNRLLQYNQPPEPNQGLEYALLQMRMAGQLLHFEAIDIPNGDTEAEIWEIFGKVFACLKHGDEVYFDITYGFRSLPMLGMVLLNYAKALRNIQVKAIYYGNFEAGRATRDHQLQQAQANGEDGNALAEIRSTPVKAPILNFSAFSQLQDWTYAGQSFLQAGNADMLARLVEDSQPELGEMLKNFTDAILTCRGGSLTRDMDIQGLKDALIFSRHEDLKVQLRPLLESIEQKLAPFDHQLTQNGLAAVSWCISHNLIQQGYTFLQETIITLVIEQALGRQIIPDPAFRTWTSGLLYGLPMGKINKPFLPDAHAKPQLQLVQQFLRQFPKIIDSYQPLVGNGGLRNDINHGGFQETYAIPTHLKAELNDHYQAITQVLKAYRLIN